MVQTPFTSPIFVETVLPFLLVFTLVFAILQKTEVLGKGKKQIDAIVGLVIGLLFVAFGTATDIVVRMIPILGIALVVILVFMLLFGFTFQPGEFKLHWGIKLTVGILVALVLVVTIMVLTGGVEYVLDLFYSDNVGFFLNGLLILVVLGILAAVVFWKDSSSGGSSSGGSSSGGDSS